MKIHGVSQSSGVERELAIERGIKDVALTIIDHVGQKERDRIMVEGGDLVGAITDPPAEGSTVEGISSAHGVKMFLKIEVRRNEVQLTIRPESGAGSDVAVGLDDFQDALEGLIT